MTFAYYSNWNRKRRSKTRIFFSKIFSIPKAIFNYLRTHKKFTRRLFKFGLFVIVCLFVAGIISFVLISLSLPDPNKLTARVLPQSTKIYARDGTTLLYEIHGEAKRTLIGLNDLPPYVKQATIAIEDKNFYNNPGFDLKGILRAVFANLSTGSLGQGGSTITQQFVRNAILTREKTFTRKIKEIVLAIEIERKFTKDEILKLYLNEIPYGLNAYGIEAAAQTYFAKHAKDLTLAEASYLAALPQAPTFYSPNGPNRDKLDSRKNVVLSLMQEQGYITEDQKEQAQKEKVVFGRIKDAILAPHFVLFVQELLAEKYGERTLQEGGLNVVTTLDWNLQQIAEKAVQDGVAKNEKNNKASNAALTAIDPKTGQILAMVGSRDFFDEKYDGQVNVALRERQPGSSIKPYIYAAAFKKGMSPATMLVDVKTMFGTYGDKEYAPSNYDGKDHGIVSIRKAFAGSLNVPAVKTLFLTGVSSAIDTAKEMGITSDINTSRCGLSLVLGGCEIKLIDHVSALGVFANGGIRQEKTPILKITDNKGSLLAEYKENPGKQVLDPQIVYEVVSIMTDNESRSIIFGPKSPLILPDRVVAAKTGTTQEWKDGWTLGFTPSLVAGVWVGNNDGSAMKQGADGVFVAAPIWNQFMREALKNTPPEEFLEPAGIQHILVDAVSGKLPTEYTPSTKTEVFAENSLPRDFDDVHIAVNINKLNGKLASASTPPDLIESRVFTVIRSEQPDNPNWEVPVEMWVTANGYVYPPVEYDDGTFASGLSNNQPRFITPVNNQEINWLPFVAQIDPGGLSPVSVDMDLEGESMGTKTSAPYSFVIRSARNGFHNLTVTLHLSNGEAVRTSIRIYINSMGL